MDTLFKGEKKNERRVFAKIYDYINNSYNNNNDNKLITSVVRLIIGGKVAKRASLHSIPSLWNHALASSKLLFVLKPLFVFKWRKKVYWRWFFGDHYLLYYQNLKHPSPCCSHTLVATFNIDSDRLWLANPIFCSYFLFLSHLKDWWK